MSPISTKHFCNAALTSRAWETGRDMRVLAGCSEGRTRTAISSSDDRWFEIWFSEGGGHLRPQWLYVVTPDTTRRGCVLVYDPQESYRVIYEGLNYEEACQELVEDEFRPVEGRMFPDDGWPLGTKSSGS
ncbi:MAG TPA: hypothetical protein VKC61_00285 [Pyrinomonadaceae bacterium]|nr:hypothetical protein [Pyrinomonadaceae bacterium]